MPNEHEFIELTTQTRSAEPLAEILAEIANNAPENKENNEINTEYTPAALPVENLNEAPENKEVYIAIAPAQPNQNNDLQAKKATIRNSLLALYDLESADKNTRVTDLITLLKEIDFIINSNHHGENLYGMLIGIFSGNDSARFARLAPHNALNTAQEVTDYILQLLPDIIWKAVNGKYPEKRGNDIHQLNNDESIEALTAENLEEIYQQLNKSPDSPLFELSQLDALRNAHALTFTQRAKEFFNESKDVVKRINNKGINTAFSYANSNVAKGIMACGGMVNLLISETDAVSGLIKVLPISSASGELGLAVAHGMRTCYSEPVNFHSKGNGLLGALTFGTFAPFCTIAAAGYVRGIAQESYSSVRMVLNRPGAAEDNLRALAINELQNSHPLQNFNLETFKKLHPFVEQEAKAPTTSASSSTQNQSSSSFQEREKRYSESKESPDFRARIERQNSKVIMQVD